MKNKYFKGKSLEILEKELDDSWRYYFNPVNTQHGLILKYIKAITQEMLYRKKYATVEEMLKKCG